MIEKKATPNEAQLKAITHGKGPLLIIAGAGTGKTSVITQRIAHLVLDKKIGVENILALTFTEKAAKEMEERVDQALPYGYVDLSISTFHSFCEKILRQHGLDIGLPTDFKLLSDTGQWMLVRQNLHLFDLDYYKPRGNPTKFIHALLSHFSRAKDETIYPEDYMAFAERDLSGEAIGSSALDEKKRVAEVARAFNIYQQLLLDKSYLDFGDLINYTLRLFKTRPNILEKYKKIFQHILVDEFQDTNYAQYELVKLLAGEDGNLTVVGDDDQSIYKFRGASISNILQFKKDYPKAKQVVLTINYRSAQEILDLAYNFIQLNNPDRLEAQKGKKKIDKKLKASSTEHGSFEHLHYQTLDDEVDGVIQGIVELKQRQRGSLAQSARDDVAGWGSFAILTRSNDAAGDFVTALKKLNIPYEFVSLRGLYNKPLIIDIVSYLKLLDNYHESPAMYRVLTSRLADMDYHDVVKLVNLSNRKAISVYEAMRRAFEAQVSDQGKSKVARILKLIEKHTEIAKLKPVSVLYVTFLQDIGIVQQLLKEESLEDKQEMELLQLFYSHIRDFEKETTSPSLNNFMAEFELELESGDTGKLGRSTDFNDDAVRIMTVHSAKGLEFDYVFIPNMVDKRFPTIERSEPIELPTELIKDQLPQGDFHIQEERRLFYVAITRAKKGVFFTSAVDYGGSREKKLSRFIHELAETNSNFKISEPISFAKQILDKKTEIVINKVEPKPEMPKHFSFSQLAAFDKCPYQYKLGFLYKIPSFGSYHFSYGRTIHGTLEKFFSRLAELMQKGQTDLYSAIENLSGKSSVKEIISLEELLKLYEDAWIDDWYANKEDKQQYFDQGKLALTQYYNLVKDTLPKVQFLEKHFTIHLEGTKGESYTIKGVIDRVDELEDGSWQIIDYKTGNPKDSLTWEQKMQLLIYQIAAQELFNKKVGKLTYYYVDANSEVSFVGTDKEIEKLKKELVDIIERLKNSNFAATPGHHCNYCDFKSICEYKVLS